MDTIYDLGKLDLGELLELQALQRKMRDATGSIEGFSALTVDELLRLEDLHYKMAGQPNPHKPKPPADDVMSVRSDSAGKKV